MNKSGTLLTSALMTLGLAAAASAADMPKNAAPMAADSPTAMTTADSMKPKKHKKKKKAAAAPTTTK